MEKFIDFDKTKGVFYDNIWLNDEKIAIKIPFCQTDINKEKPLRGIKIEEFNLRNSYLMHY